MRRAALPLRIALALACAPAAASPLAEAAGGFGRGGAIAARALPTTDAAYFNPARLARAPDRAASLSLGVFVDRTRIRLDPRPDGVDVDDAVFDARQITPDGGTARLDLRPTPTAELRLPRGADGDPSAHGYLRLAATTPLVPGTLGFGALFMAPTSAFQRQDPFYVDEREQYFSNALHSELGGDRLRTNVIAVGIGVAPLESVSLGVGAAMVTRAAARNAIFIPDPSDQSRAEVNAAIRVTTSVAPILSVELRPTAAVALSAVAHAPQRSDVEGTSTIAFWDFGAGDAAEPALQQFSFTYGYEPWRAALTVLWAVSTKVSLGGGASFSRWSSYVDRHSETPAQPWRDTLDLGGFVAWTGRYDEATLDAGWAPTPVPAQTRRENYVDCSDASLGASWARAIARTDGRLTIVTALRGTAFVSRHHAKDSASIADEFPDSVDVRTDELIPSSLGLQTNNPGFPGFTVSGVAIAAEAGLRLTL